MDITITFHSDPGHGWYEVTPKMLIDLKIQKRISSFSYMALGQGPHKDNVFLEEDCDATYFIFKARQAGWNILIRSNHIDTPWVRNLPHYPKFPEYNFETNMKEMYGPDAPAADSLPGTVQEQLP